MDVKDKMKRNRLIGKMMMLLGSLILAAGLILFGYNRQMEYIAGKVSDEALEAVQEQIDQNPHAGEVGSDKESTIKWQDTFYFGVLTIPKLDLELPVQADWSYPKLRKTPCVYTGSIQDGGLVILAHNYKRHFGRIDSLSAGDVVQVTDATGYKYEYLVEEVFTMNATDVEEMTNSSYDLTLFTCTYGGKARVTVRCVLQNKEDRYPVIDDSNSM